MYFDPIFHNVRSFFMDFVKLMQDQVEANGGGL
jgi:hypothetical protein